MLTFGIQFYFNTDSIFLIWFLSSLFFLIIFNSPLYASMGTIQSCKFLGFLFCSNSLFIFTCAGTPSFNCYSYIICLVNWDSDCQVGWVLKLAQNLGKSQRDVSHFNTPKLLYSLLSNTQHCSKTTLPGQMSTLTEHTNILSSLRMIHLFLPAASFSSL